MTERQQSWYLPLASKSCLRPKAEELVSFLSSLSLPTGVLWAWRHSVMELEFKMLRSHDHWFIYFKQHLLKLTVGWHKIHILYKEKLRRARSMFFTFVICYLLMVRDFFWPWCEARLL